MQSAIAVYSAERDANLTEIITQKSSIAIACPVVVDERFLSAVAKTQYKADAKRLVKKALATNEGQFDLHYLHTILTTTGWNRNDDVFDRAETWAARHTAEDKPFNFEHNPRQIIGHITGTCGIDDDYQLIPEDIVVDELPETFHILTSAVLYKHIASKDESLEEETAELLMEIASGKWMVSMEVLFSNFDYAIKTPDGTNHVVARSDESAFLTKHLRAYGGDGLYEGHRIGRIMRSLAFSGKGLVSDPGNVNSHIFNDVEKFQGIVAAAKGGSLLLPQRIVSSIKESNTMGVETIPASVVTDTQWAESQRMIAELRDRLVKTDEAVVEAQFATLRDEIETLNTSVADKDTELENSRTAKTEADKTTKSASAEHEKTKEELIKASEKLEEISASAKQTERVSALVDKRVSKEDAEAIVAKYAGVSDEVFEAVVSTQAELVEAKAHPFGDKDKEDKDKKDKKDKKSKASTDNSDDAAAQAAADDTLNGAQDEDGVALATTSDVASDEDEGLVSSLADYFDEVLGDNSSKNKEKDD